ncbi:hypothetical protein [Sinorhizobium meliloti]|uniref:hypothetical protein n=1 Tax=Rhizobium meliloti TaxID=382 RepID=UPI0013E2E624|nr:hypothetical protein [Sinorhizobium meliloti]
MHGPHEEGLEYEDVFFPSEDGIPPEGWFIPRSESDEMIIANHPRWFNRAGLPSHLELWKSLGGSVGNDFEVNFVPDYKILHDAGYNVLAYDLRNLAIAVPPTAAYSPPGAVNPAMSSVRWTMSAAAVIRGK